jgi:hypothetical protein
VDMKENSVGQPRASFGRHNPPPLLFWCYSFITGRDIRIWTGCAESVAETLRSDLVEAGQTIFDRDSLDRGPSD